MVTRKVLEGFLKMLGDRSQVDAVGSDVDSKGNKHQIAFPDEQLLTLEVTKVPDDETIELESITDYILKVEGFKTYRLRKGAKFIYNVNKETIIRK